MRADHRVSAIVTCAGKGTRFGSNKLLVTIDGMTVIGITGDRAFLRRLNALPTGQVLYGPQLYDCAIVVALAAEATPAQAR